MKNNIFLSKLGNFLYQIFPINKGEFGRFLPMALMMLFILANYTILRNLKDTLVVNAPGSHGNVIPYIKLMCTLPGAIIFMLFYTRIAPVMSRERVFYICLIPFLVFFGLFGLLIYPNVEAIHLSQATMAEWSELYPRLRWPIVMLGNWSYTLFYVLAELWGSAILSLLFFQFANEITKTEMARRFYPLFGFVGNIGLILSGSMTKHFSTQMQTAPDPANAMQGILDLLMPAVVIGGLIIAGLYWWMSRQTERADFELPERKKSKKPKVGLMDSLRYLLSSRYLLFMAILVLAYGLTINFVDVLWKGQVKDLMPILHPGAGKEQVKAAYLGYMADFSLTTGLLALPLMLGGGFILRRLSWLKSALITPLILFVAGGCFFGVILYGHLTGSSTEPFIMFGQTWTMVGIAATFGFWQNALTKATKYSLFDATKEMAYFPLDAELRSKGKAAVDVVGGRAGKSGGSIILMGLQFLLPTMALPGLTPYLIVIFFLAMGGWFLAVGRLNTKYLKLTE